MWCPESSVFYKKAETNQKVFCLCGLELSVLSLSFLYVDLREMGEKLEFIRGNLGLRIRRREGFDFLFSLMKQYGIVSISDGPRQRLAKHIGWLVLTGPRGQHFSAGKTTLK